MTRYFKTFFLILLISFLFFLMSCEHDHEQVPRSQAGMLSGYDENGKVWSITSIEVKGLGILEPLPCVRDNNITYFPDGRYEVNEGVTKCDPRDSPGLAGSWNFANRNRELYLQIGDSAVFWKIIHLTERMHRIEADFPGGARIYQLEPL